jgi:predicted O-methyltransferase YrrM
MCRRLPAVAATWCATGCMATSGWALQGSTTIPAVAGPALETLPRLAEEGPFDVIFIDADKVAYPQYLTWAIHLARPGSMIVADNTLRGGTGLRVQEAGATNPREAGIRVYNQRASLDPALCSSALPINTGTTISVVLARVEREHA